MTGHLDLLWKASLDSALQNETIWICSRIFSSERQHNGHQQKDHKGISLARRIPNFTTNTFASWGMQKQRSLRMGTAMGWSAIQITHPLNLTLPSFLRVDPLLIILTNIHASWRMQSRGPPGWGLRHLSPPPLLWWRWLFGSKLDQRCNLIKLVSAVCLWTLTTLWLPLQKFGES